MGFQIFEHSADIGISCEFGTLEGLFEQAAAGLLTTLGIKPGVGCSDIHRMELQDSGLDRLLVTWLQELLYLFEAKRLWPLEIRVERISPRGLTAELMVITLPEGHVLDGREIKAVTYHQLEVAETAAGWRAQFYLDL